MGEEEAKQEKKKKKKEEKKEKDKEKEEKDTEKEKKKKKKDKEKDKEKKQKDPTEKKKKKTEDGIESPIKAKKNVFIRSDEHAWLPARIVEQTAEEAVVQVFDLEDGPRGSTRREITVQLQDYPPQNALPLKNVNEYGDLIDLPFLHEVR